ncbi:hypothetical protein Pst134EA_009462 [Puccinia striiformis f. sp. tritici]|uniref:Uncharacterized protein n=2 Tax=Puccinia striiformis TaxID=27350 RepID=A0A0L0V8C8_9BASI|nr:uncharacterized protein Pst134EA_031415 [Puccinia striiformis f. sp. tritici]XP_047808392.1 hypothetical protein Pst134EA_009462 [Puccinia striiformis f. sp. tritici]KNE95532.1 hypothetical protein PSTG_11136 [Puccinia striiformis f. sp. tritici PST-78]POW18986.1 hypothetical protein PSHT_05154 [Puccinia striiformis]KAH9443353.1 hypothetical protein Pst134EA_031415 [Puccinia striiformis f. sp. tritici]KAH9468938.1 hypothetical protein Pst134EA_009462 [Puccinia striiformis f. sp. tritici]
MTSSSEDYDPQSLVLYCDNGQPQANPGSVLTLGDEFAQMHNNVIQNPSPHPSNIATVVPGAIPKDPQGNQSSQLCRSKNACKFICQLDQVMLKAAPSDPKSGPSRC